MRPTERFSSRVDSYARYRPSYPPAAIELLSARCGLNAAAAVADVGSGTGILTEQLLASGARVFAVEPNDAMRAAAEAHLGGVAGFASVKGTAEVTTLGLASVDLYVAGQAFHWFDTARSRMEALRIVKPGGFGALLWNERPVDTDAFLADLERVLLEYASEYASITASRANEASMRAFFGGTMELATFPNQQRLDFEGVKGRIMSSSYAPEPGHPRHEPMIAAVRRVFDHHEKNGEILYPYRSLVYFGQLKPLA